jgi:hypothetical protein
MRASGNYSGSVSYYESPISSFTGATIYDTDQFEYKQSAISMGYKIQPTYRSFFLSLGISCNFNFVTVTEQKKELQAIWYFDEFTQKTTYNDIYNNSNTTAVKMFVSIPFQIGIGDNIELGKFIIAPAFYFTSCFMKGYNIYNASVRLAYSIN